MSALPNELRDLIESGPMAHLTTINADGSPQVSAEFPAPKGPGYLVRYSIERVGGVGPWQSPSH